MYDFVLSIIYHYLPPTVDFDYRMHLKELYAKTVQGKTSVELRKLSARLEHIKSKCLDPLLLSNINFSQKILAVKIEHATKIEAMERKHQFVMSMDNAHANYIARSNGNTPIATR